jgi:hypothetical protein
MLGSSVLERGRFGRLSDQVTGVAWETPAAGEEVSACNYRNVNLIGLKLDPSWAFLIEKRVSWGKLYVLPIHALVDGKLVEVTFNYPEEAAETLDPEIKGIIATMRKSGGTVH